LHGFDDQGNPLPAADTEGGQAVPPAAPSQLVQDGEDQTGTGGTDGAR